MTGRGGANDSEAGRFIMKDPISGSLSSPIT